MKDSEQKGSDMNHKTTKPLLWVLSLLMLLGGAVTLCISIFGNTGDNIALCVALGLIVLANVCNLIRFRISHSNS